ncbi:MAG: hypothetical protein JXL84_02975 [Deltaproteobacteria bacterium]|nr:hypothetical protein [Deltaproteobacteria bacterium]
MLEDLPHIEPAAIKGHLSSPRLAQAFLDRVPLRGTEMVNIVLALKQTFGEKDVQKAAKRALFRLKQHGVPVPDEDTNGHPGFLPRTPAEAPSPSAFIGPLDGFGNRAVFLLIPQVPTDVDLGMGVVSDQKGFVEFAYGRFSKKRAREMKELFFEQVLHMVETPLSHVATVLESSYGENKSADDRATGEYLRLRPWLMEKVHLLSRPPVYEVIPAETLDGEAPAESQVERLLDHDWMRTWIIDPQEIGPLAEEIVKVEESPILVSKEQRANRVQDLKEDHLHRIFSEERRRLLKGRLEETAYLLHKVGEEPLARIALDAALTLDREEYSFRVNPFLRQMVERSLAYYLDSTEKEGDRAGSPGAGNGDGRLILP